MAHLKEPWNKENLSIFRFGSFLYIGYSFIRINLQDPMGWTPFLGFPAYPWTRGWIWGGASCSCRRSPCRRGVCDRVWEIWQGTATEVYCSAYGPSRGLLSQGSWMEVPFMHPSPYLLTLKASARCVWEVSPESGTSSKEGEHSVQSDTSLSAFASIGRRPLSFA